MGRVAEIAADIERISDDQFAGSKEHEAAMAVRSVLSGVSDVHTLIRDGYQFDTRDLGDLDISCKLLAVMLRGNSQRAA